MGDLDTNSDVEYRTLVCGKYVGSSSANFGIHLNSNTQDPSLEIQLGVVSGSPINVNAGSVTTASTDVQQVSAVQYTLNGRSINVNGAGIETDSNLPEKCSKVTNDLQSLSQYLSQLPPNNNVNVPTDQSGPLTFIVDNVNSDGVAVFLLSCNEALNNPKVQQIEIQNKANARVIVINLAGRTCSYRQGNMVGSWLTGLEGRSKTIWNVYEKPIDEDTKMYIEKNFMGALLAPHYSVETTSNIDGSAAVYQMVARAELHKPGLVFPECIEPQTTSQATTAAVSTTEIPPTTTTTPFSRLRLQPTPPAMSYCDETNGMSRPLDIQPDQVSTQPLAENKPEASLNPTTDKPGYDFSVPNPQITVTFTQPATMTLIYAPNYRPAGSSNVEAFTVTFFNSDGTILASFDSQIPSSSGTTTASAGAPLETTTTTPFASGSVPATVDAAQVQLPLNFRVSEGMKAVIQVTETTNNSSATDVCIYICKVTAIHK